MEQDETQPSGNRPGARPSLEESAAAWVPPWARAVPELIIEPAADNPEDPPLPPPWRFDRDEFAWEAEPTEPAGDQAAAPAASANGATATSGTTSPNGTAATNGTTSPNGSVNGAAKRAAAPEDEDDHAGSYTSLGEEELHGAVEAILLVIDEPVSEQMLAQVLEQPTDRVASALAALAQEYATAGRGFELRRAAGGWRLYTRGEFAAYVERFILDGQQVRLTQAALETLAVVAYKQPVTRTRISAIRGVNCDGVIKTLVNRGLVEECGTESESGAHLYRTTPLFLEKLGIDTVEQLPPLAPFLPDNIDEIDGAFR
ncbi:MAG: SMC-Scp complex subunit ScpB [Micromonosporaceae bacterium]